jgi:hypothetical protein
MSETDNQQTADEIEITKEMAQAGARILAEYARGSSVPDCLDEDIAIDIFKAMHEKAMMLE